MTTETSSRAGQAETEQLAGIGGEVELLAGGAGEAGAEGRGGSGRGWGGMRRAMARAVAEGDGGAGIVFAQEVRGAAAFVEGEGGNAGGHGLEHDAGERVLAGGEEVDRHYVAPATKQRSGVWAAFF